MYEITLQRTMDVQDQNITLDRMLWRPPRILRHSFHQGLVLNHTGYVLSHVARAMRARKVYNLALPSTLIRNVPYWAAVSNGIAVMDVSNTSLDALLPQSNFTLGPRRAKRNELNVARAVLGVH